MDGARGGACGEPALRPVASTENLNPREGGGGPAPLGTIPPFPSFSREGTPSRLQSESEFRHWRDLPSAKFESPRSHGRSVDEYARTSSCNRREQDGRARGPDAK